MMIVIPWHMNQVHTHSLHYGRGVVWLRGDRLALAVIAGQRYIAMPDKCHSMVRG